MNTLEKATALKDWVIGIRRDIHEHPELPFEEVRTSGIVAEELGKMGLEVKRVGKTGVLGTLKGGKPGKTIALRADMDALPVTEKTGYDFASKNPGVMHACGHDFHTSMLLGAAKLLSGMRGEIAGTVRFIFQPAEELAQGAKQMVAGGALENPRADMAFGVHVLSDIPVGMVVVQEGYFMAAADRWNCAIKGVPCHGSTPWQGKDAIVCAAALIQGLQTVVSRLNDAREPIVINIGTIKGGDRFNITPGKVEIEGMNRSFSETSRKMMPTWIEDFIKATCAAYGCEYEFSYDFSCAPLTNEPAATAVARGALTKLIGADKIMQVPKIMGSEDFSEYVAVVPGTFMVLGGRNEAKDCKYPQHSDQFKVDEDCVPIGVAGYAQVALDFLGQ
jgi:amidohydrolase